MFNICYHTFFDFYAICIFVTTGHCYCGLDNITVIHIGLKFRDLHLVSYIQKPWPFHLKSFLAHSFLPPVYFFMVSVFSLFYI